MRIQFTSIFRLQRQNQLHGQVVFPLAAVLREQTRALKEVHRDILRVVPLHEQVPVEQQELAGAELEHRMVRLRPRREVCH